MEGDICVPPSAMRRQDNAGSWARTMQPDTMARKEEEEMQTVVNGEAPGITQGIFKPLVALKLPILGTGYGVMKLAAPGY